MKKEKCYYWPFYFSLTLNQTEQKKVQSILPQLGQAQIFLWRALNIYDDFLDGSNKRQNLIKANNYYRRFLAIHYRLNLKEDYYKQLEKFFIKLEETNQREIANQKIKIKNKRLVIPSDISPTIKLSKLANKSLVLALGASALLSYLNKTTNTHRYQITLNFWRNFLSAKQLADDSYDWLEDLKNGALTNVTAPLLQAWPQKTLILKPSKKLTTLFNQQIAPTVIKTLQTFCQKAEQAIEKINYGETRTIKLKLLTPLYRSSQKAEKILKQLS